MQLYGAALAVAWSAAALAGFATPAPAAEITLLSPPSLRPVMADLVPRFEQASGHRVKVVFELMPPMARRIETGAEFDVAILTAQLIQRAIEQGKVDPSSAREIGRTGAGMAVRKGAPRPDISTVDGFRRALLAARSIGFTADGAAGNAIIAMFERIGIAAELQPKLRPLPGGGAVEPVARGEVEVSVTTIPGIMEIAGVDLVGPLPDELQSWVVYAAGASTASKERLAIKAFTDFITTTDAHAVMKEKGVTPPIR